MPKACSEAALSLLQCMERSDCCVQDKKSVYECLKQQDDEACKAQRNAYYMCKHSQLNMRTRIRGTRAY
ncbi:cytochrome c oxidase assembly protein [Nitzschia inconspicua]|uniref:Cytochrome c oxidase assembly protein n=1 Tax=Nitzschia inconspicua TaxID=303405 RepID=A0A9K3KMD3_9STRA|nr:cytochrome c oxidase assembly protein [Nitzschia inconspicua]